MCHQKWLLRDTKRAVVIRMLFAILTYYEFGQNSTMASEKLSNLCKFGSKNAFLLMFCVFVQQSL